MKKYILVIMLSIVSLVSFNITQAQTATNENDACKDKKNGDACSYSTSGRGAQTGSTTSGFCDRTNGDSNSANNPLTCRSGDAWGDRCAVLGDACLGTTSTPGQRGTTTTTGTCTNRTTPAGPRTPARTSMICDTSVKPPGNPGGRSSDGSTGGGTCQDCGGNKCDPGQVCADQGPDGQKKPTCVTDKGNNNTCGGNACSAGQVCIEDGPPTARTATCVSNKCTGGGGAGNGGGGTTPSENTTPTDATAPQTVGFINPIRFNSLTELIAGIINALLGILGAITVAVLVKSGFQYMISSNPGEVGQSLDGIKNAIIGLMIIMGAFLITQYVITALAG